MGGASFSKTEADADSEISETAKNPPSFAARTAARLKNRSWPPAQREHSLPNRMAESAAIVFQASGAK
jgi:hypothetical protein